VIEGLAQRRFAIYLKVHHALFDGASGILAFVRGVSEDPAASVLPVWSAARRRRNPSPSRGADAPKRGDERALDTLHQACADLPALYAAFARLAKAAVGKEPHLIAPYTGPHCLLNGPVSQSRSIASQKLPLPRVKTLARRTGTTVNDVLLTVCGGAIRRYLQERSALPNKSLIAGVPVALSDAGIHTSGNEVGLICASLASNLKQPLRRLRAVARTTIAGKQHLQGIPSQVRAAYTMLIVLPAFVYSLLPGFGRPISNIAVSNMVGHKDPLYLNGALLEEVYPTSVLTGGCALNISAVSYNDCLYLGLVACPDVIPQIQRLAAYLGDAFRELETAVRRLPHEHQHQNYVR
jgi:WS/DGAT/MGAT family acyltransferase